MSDWYAESINAAKGEQTQDVAGKYAKTQEELGASGAGLNDQMSDYDTVAMADDLLPMDGSAASMDYARPLTQQLGARDARTSERLTSPQLENPELWEHTVKAGPDDVPMITIRRGMDDPEPEPSPAAEPYEPVSLRKYEPRSEADIMMGGLGAAAEAGVTTLARGVYKFGTNVWEFAGDVSEWLDGKPAYRPPTAEQVGIRPPANLSEAFSTDIIRYGIGLTAATKALEGLALSTTAATVTGTTAKAAAVGGVTDMVVTDPKVDASLYDVAQNFFAAEAALGTSFTIQGLVESGPAGVMAGRLAAGAEGAVLGELIQGTLKLTGKGLRSIKDTDAAQEAIKAGRAFWLKGENLEQVAHKAMLPMMRATVNSGMSPEMGVWLGVWLMAKMMKGVRQVTPDLVKEVKPLGITDKEFNEVWNKTAKISQRAKKAAMQDWGQNAPKALQKMMDREMQMEARALLDDGAYHVTQYLRGTRAMGIADEVAMANWNAAAKARNDEQVAILLREPQQLPAPNQAGLEAMTILRSPQIPTRAPKDYAGPTANKKQIAKEFHKAALAGVGGKPRNLDDSPENVERVAQFFAHEVELAARQPGSAADWYRGSIEDYHKLVSQVWPEVATSPDARLALDFATAITSNNEAVKNNVRVARKVYKHFRTKGKGEFFPEDLEKIGAGVKNSEAMEQAFTAWNSGVRRMGRKRWQQFLNSEWTAPELSAMGFEGVSLPPGARAPGSIVFGPKVGGAFFQNLEGNLSRSTIDLWYRRTFGRATGAVMESSPKILKDAESRLLEAANTPATLRLLKTYTDRDVMPTDPEVLEDVAAAIFNGWSGDKAKLGKTVLDKKGKRKPNAYELGVSDDVDNFHRAARQYNKLKNDAINAPTDKERVIMEKAIARTVTILEDKGYNTSPADVQALLWYWEQRLWKHKGLDIDSSTDYPTEMAELMVKEGDLTNEHVQTALGKGNKRGIKDVQSGLGRRDGEDTRRFTEERDRRRFYKQWTGDDLRGAIARGRIDAESGLYTVGGKGGSARVLTPAGKRYKNGFKGRVWSSKDQTYNGRWKLHGVTVPKFVEADLGQSPLAYEAFADTLDKSRARLDELIEGTADKTEKADLKKAKLSLGDYTAADYAEGEARVFLTPEGDAGFALVGEDIVSVFKSPDTDKKEVALHVLAAAIQAGGRKLDNFHGPLSALYQHVGMVPVSRTPFDLKQKPKGWDARTMGKPDIMFMAYNPKSKGTNINKEDVLEFSDYGDAMEYRDNYLKRRGRK